jgi:hypothetical protein
MISRRLKPGTAVLAKARSNLTNQRQKADVIKTMRIIMFAA